MTCRNVMREAWPWMLAGIVSGMAILTRATGLVLVGVVGLALILQILTRTQAGAQVGQTLRHAVTGGFVWLVTTAGTIYLLLPALWVEPVSTLNKLWSWSSNAATEGHENPTFFHGIHLDDPGPVVYPVVLIWRTSPVEWVGVLLFILFGALAWRQRRYTSPKGIQFILVCMVFLIVYVAAMSIGAKKFDRYVLPVFPFIALFAAQGIVWARMWLHERKSVVWKRAGYALVIGAVIFQALSWDSTRPYRLDYYNPVLGGTQRAQEILQMGWGQGGDQVVEFLEGQIDDGPIIVQTSAVPSAFTYFLEDDSPIQFRGFSLRTPAGWYETDYYIAGIQQTQRGLARDYELLRDQVPVYFVNIGGVSYFDVFDVNKLPLPDELRSPTACNLTFGDSIALMQIIGRDDTIDFYFLSTRDTSQQSIDFEVRIDWPDGTSTVETATLIPADKGLMSRLTIPFQPTDIPLADAAITIRGSSNSQPLLVSASWIQDLSTKAVTHSECFYTAPPE